MLQANDTTLSLGSLTQLLETSQPFHGFSMLPFLLFLVPPPFPVFSLFCLHHLSLSINSVKITCLEGLTLELHPTLPANTHKTLLFPGLFCLSQTANFSP